MRQGGIDPPNQNPVDVTGLDGSLNGLAPSRDRLKQSRPKQHVSKQRHTLSVTQYSPQKYSVWHTLTESHIHRESKKNKTPNSWP